MLESFPLFNQWWVLEIFTIENKLPLETEDFIPLLDEDKTQNSVASLQRMWHEKNSKLENERSWTDLCSLTMHRN